MDTIKWIQHIMESHADRPFLIDAKTGRSITYGQLHDMACALGAHLQGRGLAKGDRVGIVLHNSLEFAVLYFACLYSGIVTVPINPVLTSRETSFILSNSGAKHLFTTSDLLKNIPVPEDFQVFLLDAPDARDTPFESLAINDLPKAKGFQPLHGIRAEDPLTIVFTSGTTAMPKGVAHRIADLIDNARLFCKVLEIGPENRFYGILAMTYLGGYYNLLLLPFAAGASVVLSRAFDASSALRFWTPAIEHGVNTLWLVPSIMSILLETDKGEKGKQFCRENVIKALVGTAPLQASLKKEFESRYDLTLYENYGLSETLFISTESPHANRIEGGIGQVMPGIQVAIKDEKGSPLPHGEEGEIFVSTPFLMEGYLDLDTCAPAVIDRGSFFPTGDIGIFSGAGDLAITGRKKDLIIRGGINISPAVIEEAIQRAEGVATCAVVGVPHRFSGEEIVAVIRLVEKHEFGQVRQDLETSLKTSLSKHQLPAHILEIDSFPLSSTGKIMKNKLRTIVMSKLGITEEASRPAPAQAAIPLMVPGIVKRAIKRPDRSLVEELSRYPVSILSDCLNRMGAVDGAIFPLQRGLRCCGPAVTVDEVEAGNLMSHIALELLQPGDVLVIDAKGVTTRACFGGLQLHMAKMQGAAGVVIDGAYRDYEAIGETGVPVFARGTSPGGPLKGWSGNINMPMAVGGIPVNPGDIVAGDSDGVAVIPQDMAKEVAAAASQRLKLEEGWFKAIKEGQATLDAVGLRDAVTKFSLRYK